MPVIKVYGIPKSAHLLQIDCLMWKLQDTAVALLGLSGRKQVTCYFPQDKRDRLYNEDIVAFVDGLFIYEMRTSEFRLTLASAIGSVLQEEFPDCFVECFVRPFNPKDGFWSSNKKD